MLLIHQDTTTWKLDETNAQGPKLAVWGFLVGVDCSKNALPAVLICGLATWEARIYFHCNCRVYSETCHQSIGQCGTHQWIKPWRIKPNIVHIFLQPCELFGAKVWSLRRSSTYFRVWQLEFTLSSSLGLLLGMNLHTMALSCQSK